METQEEPAHQNWKNRSSSKTSSDISRHIRRTIFEEPMKPSFFSETYDYCMAPRSLRNSCNEWRPFRQLLHGLHCAPAATTDEPKQMWHGGTWLDRRRGSPQARHLRSRSIGLRHILVGGMGLIDNQATCTLQPVSFLLSLTRVRCQLLASKDVDHPRKSL